MLQETWTWHATKDDSVITKCGHETPSQLSAVFSAVHSDPWCARKEETLVEDPNHIRSDVVSCSWSLIR